MVASTLCTIHNERFVVRLVDDIRASIEAGTFYDFKIDFLGRYYGGEVTARPRRASVFPRQGNE